MTGIAESIICYGCDKCKKKEIIEEGIMYDNDTLRYFVEEPKETYIISSNYIPSQTLLKNNLINYVPRFGKYEVENFLAQELAKILFVTKDLSYLFSTTIMVDNFMSKSSIFNGDVIKQRFLPLFDVEKSGKIYTCTFKEERVV